MKWVPLAAALWASVAVAVADNPVSISRAWVRAGPPSVSVYAGYMAMENLTARDLTITRVSSPRFASVEMHRTEIENGIARMTPQANLVVPANRTLEFVPGGLHLMLLQPDAPLTRGEAVPLHIEFADAGSIDTELPVLAAPPEP